MPRYPLVFPNFSPADREATKVSGITRVVYWRNSGDGHAGHTVQMSDVYYEPGTANEYCHRGADVIIRVLQGAGMIEFNGDRHPARSGDVFTIPAGIQYRMVASGSKRPQFILQHTLVRAPGCEHDSWPLIPPVRT